MSTPAELLQLQRKAERQLIAGYEPGFTIDSAKLDALSQWSRSDVSAESVAEGGSRCAGVVPNVSVEVQVWDEPTYGTFVHAGCDGLVVYQGCYDARVDREHHLEGNKRFFEWRLGAPERAADA